MDTVRRWGPAAAVVLVACLLPLRGLWRAPGPPMEEGFMLVFPWLVNHGWVPNRDFLHLYGPGSLWVLALAFRALGTTIEVERAVGFLQQLGVAFGVFALLRPWGRVVAVAGAAMAAVVVVPPIGLTALAWTGAVALGLWSLVLAFPPPKLSHPRDKPPTRGGARGGRDFRAPARMYAAGGLAAAALLYRPDLAVAIGLAAIAVQPTKRMVAAFAVGLSPYLVHLVMAGPSAVFKGLFLEPVFELRGGRRLPLPPSWHEFDGFLQRAGRLIEPPWPLPAPPSPAQLSLWLGLLIATDAVLIVAGILRKRRLGDARLLAMALFAAGLLPQALQRADSTHLAWVSCVPLGFLPAAVAELLRGRRWPTTVTAALAPIVATLVLVPHFTWRTYVDYLTPGPTHAIVRNGRTFYYGRPDAVRAVHDLLQEVDRTAKPGDKLFVGTGDLRKTPYSEAFLYYLLPELPPATRFIEIDPGVANAEDSGMAGEIEHADIVILSSIRDDWDEPNDSRHFGPDEPNRVVARDFCLVGSYGKGLFGRGLYELYARCQ
jgi:hypothetical protein